MASVMPLSSLSAASRHRAPAWFVCCMFILFSMFALGTANAQLAAIPPLQAHVTDQAGMLTAQQRGALENVLADYEAKTGSQIAVLLVRSTAPEAIEQYSIRVTDAWKLGRKGVDDGVLLMVAKDNPAALRRLRIEAGRGVQGVLTDAQSKRVLQDVIAPHFRQEDYYGGLVAGVGAIATLLNNEQFPGAPQQGQAQAEQATQTQQQQQTQQQPQRAAGSYSQNWLVGLFLGVFFLIIILARKWTRVSGRRDRHSVNNSDWVGNVGGVVLGAVLDGIFSGGSGGRGNDGGGGFSGGGGGGFSGGGGTFDGGGASGNW
jgi:uncharacterized protein